MNQLSKYREDQKRLLDDASTGTQRPPRVSISGNQFTLIDPSGTSTQVPNLPDGPALDVVIVDRNVKTSKLFWGLNKAYNPNELSPPVCFSDNGLAPSSMAQEPQSATCAACAHNVIGSAISQISGARIKACQDLKKMAVAVKNFQGVYEFQIKPGSFKNWNNYTNWLRLQKLPDGGKPDLSDVVTRIRFVGQGILSFEATEIVDDGSELAAQVIEIWEANKQNDITGMMIGRYDQPAQGVLPASPSAPVLVAPKAAAPPPQAQLQGQGIFFQPPKSQVAAPAAPATEEPKRRGRPTAAKKDEPAQIVPAKPAPPHGMQAPQGSFPPADVQSRLSNLFKLPPAK